MNLNQQKQVNFIIESLGGTLKTASLYDITPGTVSAWRRNGIPKPWMLYFQVKYPHLFKKKSPRK